MRSRYFVTQARYRKRTQSKNKIYNKIHYARARIMRARAEITTSGTDAQRADFLYYIEQLNKIKRKAQIT